MKRLIATLLALLLICACTLAAADGVVVWTCASCGALLDPNECNFCPKCGTPLNTSTAISAGDTVIFGRYEQDNNSSNGPEPVEWLVLNTEGDRALLISRYVLEVNAFHKKDEWIYWENCSLRTWLNGHFMDQLFTDEEKAAVQETYVSNAPWQGTPDLHYSQLENNKDTRDRLFLLSYQEAWLYFGRDTDRIGRGTPYAVARALNATDRVRGEQTPPDDTDNCWWWLRIRGAQSNSAGLVNADGSLGNSTITYKAGGIRPAMWVDVSALN